jgi:hypothetical protein
MKEKRKTLNKNISKSLRHAGLEPSSLSCHAGSGGGGASVVAAGATAVSTCRDTWDTSGGGWGPLLSPLPSMSPFAP